MINTIQTNRELEKVDKTGFDAEVEFAKIIYGLTDKQVGKMSARKIKEINDKLAMQNKQQLSPIYMFMYKGKEYAYHPLELGTVEEIIGFNLFMENNRWNALAALMFREVKTNKSKGDWRQACGMNVKFITNFQKDYSSYSTKKIKDFAKLDLEHWDDLPFQVISTMVAFSFGNGLAYKTGLGLYSQKSLQQRQKLILSLFNNLLFGMESRLILQELEKARTSSGTAEKSQYYKSLSKLCSTGCCDKTTLLKHLNDNYFVLNGGSFQPIITMVDNLYNGKLTTDDTKLIAEWMNVSNILGNGKI